VQSPSLNRRINVESFRLGMTVSLNLAFERREIAQEFGAETLRKNRGNIRSDLARIFQSVHAQRIMQDCALQMPILGLGCNRNKPAQ
jgi:hypothetical protein